MTFFEAVRAWKSVAGACPIAITVLIEGEEECGSPSLPGFLAKHGKEVTADLALVCDTGQWDKDTPAISTQLRGLAAHRARHHRPEPRSAFRQLRRRRHEPDPRAGQDHGRDARRQRQGAHPRLLRRHQEALGQAAPAVGGARLRCERVPGRRRPEPGVRASSATACSSRSGRGPTVEFNGITGGYQGVGSKTVIPSQASVKITCRLVPGQDPEKVLKGIEQFVQGASARGLQGRASLRARLGGDRLRHQGAAHRSARPRRSRRNGAARRR